MTGICLVKSPWIIDAQSATTTWALRPCKAEMAAAVVTVVPGRIRAIVRVLMCRHDALGQIHDPKKPNGNAGPRCIQDGDVIEAQYHGEPTPKTGDMLRQLFGRSEWQQVTESWWNGREYVPVTTETPDRALQPILITPHR